MAPVSCSWLLVASKLLGDYLELVLSFQAQCFRLSETSLPRSIFQTRHETYDVITTLLYCTALDPFLPIFAAHGSVASSLDGGILGFNAAML